ncbi:c-type cytochrome [Pedosphaera parvula]|uniref:Cytochrome c class I n=1 Tax=Pedosphaera parvula (strain Ellin514) TaxID=320771 RepID=B9XE40_PEDPL|nr:cytochrome c [Pedosphaera parvula]EEF61931.1 cytochrome c class I [Pedosphaera parvula Ellin514]
MRYFLLILVLCSVAVFAIAGKRGATSRKPPIEIFPDMDRQPKLRPQTPNNFFANGRSSQVGVPGTIAQGDVYETTPFTTGHVAGKTNYVDVLPVKVTLQLLERGQQRFNINCSPCHGAQGDGNGITKKIGAMAIVANLHDKRIVELQDGEIFNTITYGKNLMGPYGANVTVEDRWAIVAYLRSLQLSKLGTLDDVPEPLRASLKK